MTAELRVTNLSCHRHEQMVFKKLSFAVQARDILIVTGINGAGKSSLLRLLAGLATPHTGDITWHGVNIQQSNAFYQEQLHFLGHANGLKLGLTVLENLTLASHLATQSLPLHYEKVLADLQLQQEQHTIVRFLSAGQKRRVALARLFLFPKLIWLLDEPLTALDSHTQAYFLQQLQQHRMRGGIAIISSHHVIEMDGVKGLRL